jgi:predicted nucleotidyltransferase
MGRAPQLDEVIALLKQHESFFREKGVVHLAVFGSVARGDATPDSDIDLVIDYDPDSAFSLLTLAGVANEAEAWLGRKVDLLTRPGLKPRVAVRVERDQRHVF